MFHDFSSFLMLDSSFFIISMISMSFMIFHNFARLLKLQQSRGFRSDSYEDRDPDSHDPADC